MSQAIDTKMLKTKLATSVTSQDIEDYVGQLLADRMSQLGMTSGDVTPEQNEIVNKAVETIAKVLTEVLTNSVRGK